MKKVAIIGSGPAALMAADVISRSRVEVHLFEKRKSSGRKLLIAGASGLNITHELPLDHWPRMYTGGTPQLWLSIFKHFSPSHWIEFIQAMGLETFLGTSRRYFIREMKASKLLQIWMNQLKSHGVQFHFEHELTQFEKKSNTLVLQLNSNTTLSFDAVCLALGGGSYEPQENPLKWPNLFHSHGIKFIPFRASNVGYRVAWKESFLREACRQPLKNIQLTTTRGTLRGELLITEYGLEGTPIYFLGEKGHAQLDLKPDLSQDQILQKLNRSQENLSPLRKVKKHLSLCPAALALLYHHAPQVPDLKTFIHLLKHFPMKLLEAQPLEEAISSAGGVSWEELTDELMLKKLPGYFLAGEMLNWDAPTGGFLIQGCVSQGAWMGKSVLKYLNGG